MKSLSILAGRTVDFGTYCMCIKASRARGLIFDLGLPLISYCVYVRSQGSGNTLPIRGATMYMYIMRYGKPILRYTWYLYFCLLLPLVQNYNIIQGS